MNRTMSWVTYNELAAARRITAESAKRLAQRNGWQRRQADDGTHLVQILVPQDLLAPREAQSLLPPEAAALREEVASLRRIVMQLVERLDAR
jgi:hypothetical protein